MPRLLLAGPGRRADLLFAVLVTVVGAWLIHASENLIFQNNGDFQRTSLFMLADVTRNLDTVRTFRPGGFLPIEEFSAASYLFLAFGWLQRLVSDHYDLAVSSIAGKVVLLGLLAALAHAVAGRARPLVRGGLFIVLAFMAFASHNIGLMKSFYFEYAIFLALPMLLAGFFARSQAGRIAGLGAGSLLAGLAKIQYFYVPLLALACLYVASTRSSRPGAGTVATLVIAQALCLIPLWATPHSHLYYYHSTYFGTYMLLEPAELRRIGLLDRELACVGVDSWGNFAEGVGGIQVRPGKPTCVQDRVRTIRDVLEPYVRYPSLIFRMPAFALPSHFTVDYFHVYPSFRFLQALTYEEPEGQRLLLRLTKWRERYLTPAAAAMVTFSVAVVLVGRRKGETRYASALLFLALLLVSQIAVSLLAEGIRDMSKHLWAAQLGLDLMLPVLAMALVDLWRKTQLPRSMSRACVVGVHNDQ